MIQEKVILNNIFKRHPDMRRIGQLQNVSDEEFSVGESIKVPSILSHKCTLPTEVQNKS